MDNFIKEIIDEMFEKKANKFEMPENHNCKCKLGKSYCKESSVCKKCVLSERLSLAIRLKELFKLLD